MNEETEAKRVDRIGTRAYQMWEDEGRPEGQADAHWDRATELVAIEDNHQFAMEPIPDPDDLGPTGEPIEPLLAVRNAGEFPTMTDQGEEETFPSPRSNETMDQSRPAAAQASSVPATEPAMASSSPTDIAGSKKRAAASSPSPKKPKGKSR